MSVRSSWRRLGLRQRLLLIGVAGVATALLLGGLTLYGALSVLSYRTLDAGARATADDVTRLVTEGRLPDLIPVTGGQIVQVVDGHNRVVSASSNADRLTALLRPSEVHRALAGHAVVVSGSRVGLASPLRVLAVSAGPGHTVVVAQPFGDVQHSEQILAVALLLGGPALLLVLSLMAWRVMGATLRPVESMRVTAEHISGAGDGDEVRLPVPVARDEFQRLAITLNAMLDRLEGARARQRRFVADAAHELRSPLASLQAQLDVAERLDEELPGAADVRAEVTRMTGLVEDLLSLARLDSGAERLRAPETVTVQGVLEEVTQRYAHARVPVVVATSEHSVRARPEDLDRALANLVDNAVRHASSRVEVTAHDAGDLVVVAVEDDGAGIPEADRGRVLERFTRLDAGRTRDTGGSGLGLAIVHELVRHGGGSLRLGESTLGGLRAEIVLPAAGPAELRGSAHRG